MKKKVFISNTLAFKTEASETKKKSVYLKHSSLLDSGISDEEKSVYFKHSTLSDWGICDKE